MPRKRGAFDFEAWRWDNPLCCALVWGPKGDRRSHFITDAPPYENAREMAATALRKMSQIVNTGEVTEWWAHNAGRYDGLILAEVADTMGWKVSCPVANGRPVYFDFIPPGARHFRVFDSYCVAPSSLKSLVGDWDLPSKKLFTEDDYSIDVRLWDPARRKRGCLTDAELVLELLDKIETQAQEWGVKNLSPTFSGMALSVIRTDLKFKGLRLPSHEWNHEILQLCEPAYLGGRVEIYHHRLLRLLREWDISSSYPASMCKALPWELLGKISGGKKLRNLMEGNGVEGIVQAKVFVPQNMHIPPLPFIPPTEGVYFPTGTWTGSFAACELRYAESLGCGVVPISGVAYTSEAPFKDFVHKVYAEKLRAKLEGRPAVCAFNKLVLNGGYGKFGQGPELETLHICATDDEGFSLARKHAATGARPLASGHMRYMAVTTYRMPQHTHYGIAAYVTAYSRIAVHSALLAATNPCYTDTDSVHAEALQEHLVGEGLGRWEEKRRNFHGEYFAPKLYRLQLENGDWHFASKGLPLQTDEAFDALLQEELDSLRARAKASRFDDIVHGRKIRIATIAGLKTQLAKHEGRFTRLGGDWADPLHRSWKGHSTKRRSLEGGATVPWTADELLSGKHLDEFSPLYLGETMRKAG